MAIRFRSGERELRWDPAARAWVGDARLARVIDRYPPLDVELTVMGPTVAADDSNEVWVYEHALDAFQAAGIAPDIEAVDKPLSPFPVSPAIII